MCISRILACAAATAAGLWSISADAAIVTFSSRPVYLAAVGATVNENFSGFTVDSEFRTTTVAANGFTLRQEGSDAAFRNLVDVTPLLLTDNNGTAHASSFVDFPSSTVPGGVNVRVAFPGSASGFGADFYGINGTPPFASAEGLTATVFVNNVASGSPIVLPNTVGTTPIFFGVFGNAGENITSVLLQARGESGVGGPPGSLGEGFGMDDVAVAPIPEPSLVTVALAVPMLLRRKRA